jgi:hypothetical protein
MESKVEPRPPAADTPAPEPEKKEARAGSAPSSLEDYFPVKEGTQWTYAYLNPDGKGTGDRQRTVRCLSTKTMSNGTVRTVMEVEEGGSRKLEKYSLFLNRVEHREEGDKALMGQYALKLPSAGETEAWNETFPDGSLHSMKAVFGPAQILDKNYGDCLIVTEKVEKGGSLDRILISYYARGVGLVSVEHYRPGPVLVPEKSLVLLQP